MAEEKNQLTDEERAKLIARKRKLAQKRKQQEEEENYDSALESLRARALFTVVLFIVIIAISFATSGRSGWFFSWSKSLFLSFSSWSNLAVIATIICVVLTALAWFLPNIILRNSDEYQSRISRKTIQVSVTSLIAMISLGLIIPSAAWKSASPYLPGVKFERCIESLRNDATIVVNEGNGGVKYATVANIKNGIHKYALEKDEDGNWTVTDMFTNKPVDNLAGC